MVLYFENSNYQREKLCESSKPHRIKRVINEFLNQHNYQAPYWKYSFDCENHNILIDVGSHSEFFIVEDASKEEMRSWEEE